MKNKKRISSLILAVLMFVTLNSFSLMAYAAEQGTESNPYQITTAQELQNINDNVSAHYKLMADIDLKNAEFTPIGNADSGAFSGTFDGNGYTISNLNVFSGKYAGLFGCNEGIIKNVTLKDIYVYGTRYLGGVVAENTSLGTIADCKVLNGKIESDGGLNDINAGGICGSNNGAFEGEFSNGADLEIAGTIAGGIIGENNYKIILTASNSGNIFSWVTSGGLIGYSNLKVTVNRSDNTGNIQSGSSGGLIGKGGADISESFNSGNISGYYAGGLIGSCIEGITTNINNSYNCGNIDNNTYEQCKLGGFVGYMFANYPSKRTYLYVSNCYNSGNIRFTGGEYDCFTNRILGYGDNGCYYSRSQTYGNLNSYLTTFGNAGYMDVNYLLSNDNMKNKEKFVGWDFNSIWEINENVNNGYPTLKNCNNELQLDYSVYNVGTNKTFKLNAYTNGVIANNVNWSCSSGNATVSSNGVVTISGKTATITATDSNGNKANCNVYSLTPATSVSMTNRFIDMTQTTTSYSNYSIIGGSGDYIVDLKSSDNSVVTVDYNGILTPKSPGTATITATTAGGATGTQKVTVVNTATKISLSNSSMTVARGSTKQLTATTTPSPTSSNITWSSSDTNVATVDQNGNVTGIGVGSATITVSTDNGYSATCSITVNMPITTMEFENPSVTIYKDDVQKLNLIYAPADTTDNISYSCSVSSSYLSVDSSGVITANRVGTYTVTATASSGVKAYCTVKVIDYPVVVTDITLDQEEHDMLVGDVFKLNATVSPSNATDKTVTWASTDESVATVSQGGTVEAKGAGKTVITATTQNGIIAYCIVNVTGVASTNLSKIYVPDVLDSNGEYVEIPVMIENNPGINFASLTVQYNPDELEPIEVKNGDIFESVLGNIDKSNNEVKLYFTSDIDIKADGIFAKIKCKVLNNSTSPQVKLYYFPSEIRNVNSESVAFNLIYGQININEHIHNYGEWVYHGNAVYNSSSDYKNGTQTRVCSVCGEEETIEAPNTALLRRRGNALELESAVKLNVFIAKDTVDYYDEVYAEFKFANDDDEPKKVYSYKSYNSTYYQFDFQGIAPQRMGDIIEVTFYGIKDGVKYWGTTYSYKITDYLVKQISTTSNAEYKTMLVDLLYYGAACQTYQLYKMDSLMTDLLTEEQKACRSTEKLAYTNIKNASHETCENRYVRFGTALRLYSAVEMAIALNISNNVDINDLEFKVQIEGRDLTYSMAENPDNFKKVGDYWYFYFDGVYANQFSSPVYITAYLNGEQVSYTLLYSVESYVATNTDSALQPVLDAMMHYGNSAKVYAGK